MRPSESTASLAFVAARIIVQSELTDWALARRKALIELGLPAHGAALPSDDEIITEIKIYHALYGGDAWAAQLRAQREYALEAMMALMRFHPMLIGPVAEGWAHAGSEIRIELSADNTKEIEYQLIDLGVVFSPSESARGALHFEVIDGDWPMRLIAANPAQMGARRKTRLNAQQLSALLSSRDDDKEKTIKPPSPL